MTTIRRAPRAVLASILLAATGCSERPAAPPAPAAAVRTPAAAAAPGIIDGAPRSVRSADSVPIEYRVYGRGEPALVFIHGWSCDSSYWRAQVEEFRSRYTVATVDLAGHGASGRNRTSWSMAAFGADVAAVARELPNEKLVLIGHSMGGPVALAAAPALGERLLGIIGIDTFKSVDAVPQPRSEADAVLAQMKADFVGTTREFVDLHFFAKGADPALRRQIVHDMALAPPEVAIPALAALLEMDHAAALAGAGVPIVAINADLGAPTDEAGIRTLAPRFRLEVVEGLGHFLMMEDPPRVNALIEREVRSLLAR